MSLKEEDRRILVQLELEKADKTLSQVAVLQREGYWDTMANRIYYSLFHAIGSVVIVISNCVNTSPPDFGDASPMKSNIHVVTISMC